MNLFDKAKANSKATPAKTAKAKKVVDRISMPGLDRFAKINAVVKALTTLAATEAAELKAKGFEMLVEAAHAAKRQPDNLKVEDGISIGSIEMRKRSTASVLTAEECALLDEHGVPYETKVTVEEHFALNPIYMHDKKLMNKVAKALEAAGVPDDFIKHFAEVSSTVVSEATLDTAFRDEAPAEILDMLTTMAIKPSVDMTKTTFPDLLVEIAPLLEVAETEQ